jgi:hypothetical protein
MNDKTLELKTVQDKIHSIMNEMMTSFKEEQQTRTIIMNLTNVSKELNSMINISIVGNLGEKSE